MKIGMIASTYPRFRGDGAGHFVQSIAEGVAALGHEVHVLAPFHPKVRPFDSPVHMHHFRYIWPDSAAVMGYAEAMQSDRRLRPLSYALVLPFWAAGALALQRLAARCRFDVLHVHWVIPNGAMALPAVWLRRLPLVVSLHGSDIFVARHHRLFGLAARMVFARAGAVSACSPDLRAGALALGAPPARVQLVPYGADPAVFAADRSVEAADLRRRWNIPPSAPVALNVGRLVKKKGVEYLVRAWPQTLRALPEARLVIVGEGPERESLERLAAQEGVAASVIFAGAARWDEVPAYLQMGDVFAAPSIHDQEGNVDGLPNTILEAMAASRPVVASRVAGIPLAVNDGETGLLVEERQPAPLAEALTRLLADPALRLQYGRAASARIQAELSWPHVAQRFVQLYEEAALGRAGTK